MVDAVVCVLVVGAAEVVLGAMERTGRAQVGLLIPPSSSTTGTDMESWSSRMRSMAKSTSAAAATTSTKTISYVMRLF